MKTVAWLPDSGTESSFTTFVDVPDDDARPLFDVAEKAGRGEVIADIEGSVVVHGNDLQPFARWCLDNLRGRSRAMAEARQTAISRGWMRAPRGKVAAR